MRLLHYSDVENAYDRPERIGRLAGLLQSERDDSTVVVGTGDNVGPGVLAMETDGRQSLDFFRAVEPTVETLGNHDFDFELEATRRVVAESPQTWVSANIEDGEEVAPDTTSTAIVERDGETVGFVGVTDPGSSVPDSLTVSDPKLAVREATAELREAGVDWVVALAHVGDEQLERLTETDVDVILAGHIHREQRERSDGTLVVRPGANGRIVWEVELGEQISATRHEVPDAPLDESVAEQLRERMEQTGLAEVVGRAPEPLPRDREQNFAGETRIKNFVADAYLWATDADLSFFDTGMLREGDPFVGEMTVADLRGLAPFEAHLRTASVSGGTLRELIDQSIATDERAARHDTEVMWWGHFAGLTLVWDRDEKEIREIRIGGDPLDSEATYTLATTGYVLIADEFPALSWDDRESSWGVQYDALVEYAREVGVVAELDGRIVVES
ncbi:bifunctional metallophosphatase/5'-nucleotidase [Halorussus halophilus]|uniref:bifunctional metallophosphatase/5'-nucleotidase n=1 Tax=Halorussus halophilus TaxID=2650975 RepID=UPI001301568B|nr:5'-nucleotidase C-terminal domain-containing protein [Halorussus halophilus]